MNNPFMRKQTEKMLETITIYNTAMEMAAKLDDGVISKEEQKELAKIKAASEKYRQALQKLLDAKAQEK